EHTGIGKHYTSHYEYEFRVNYNSGNQDLQLNDGARTGFLIHYHDADKSAGERDFYWEYSSNSNGFLVNETATPDLYGAMGWATFPLGAPYVQTVFLEDGATVEGVVNIRVYAEDEDGVGGIDSAKFYKASDTTSQIRLTRIANLGEWSGTWDVKSLSDGSD